MPDQPCDKASTDLREMFASRGLRCTRQREEIYRALAETRSHPTAEELFETVRGRLPGVSLATVYNTLDAFVREGLCLRLSCPASDACRFDADTSEHAHLVLPDGRVVDVPPDISKRLLDRFAEDDRAELERRLGVRVAGISLQIVAAGHGGG